MLLAKMYLKGRRFWIWGPKFADHWVKTMGQLKNSKKTIILKKSKQIYSSVSVKNRIYMKQLQVWLKLWSLLLVGRKLGSILHSINFARLKNFQTNFFLLTLIEYFFYYLFKPYSCPLVGDYFFSFFIIIPFLLIIFIR